MTTNEITAKNRSYDLHEALADFLGQPRYQGGYTCSVEVTLDDGRTGTLTSTSNAGFRGIEGRFIPTPVIDPQLGGATREDRVWLAEQVARKGRFSTSLGHVAAWEIGTIR